MLYYVAICKICKIGSKLVQKNPKLVQNVNIAATFHSTVKCLSRRSAAELAANIQIGRKRRRQLALCKLCARLRCLVN
jgi:hypothetical protein